MKLLFDFGDPGEIPAGIVTGSIPELDPPVAARLAARPGGIETWPDIALLAPQLSLPSDLRLRQLARSDIPRMIALLPTWFPGLVGSSREGLLRSCALRSAPSPRAFAGPASRPWWRHCSCWSDGPSGRT